MKGLLIKKCADVSGYKYHDKGHKVRGFNMASIWINKVNVSSYVKFAWPIIRLKGCLSDLIPAFKRSS